MAHLPMKSLRDILDIPVIFEYYQRWIFGRQLAARHQALLQELDPKPSDRVLDVGSGVVTLLPDCKYVGTDLNEKYLAYSKHKWNIPLLRSDIRKIPFTSGSFDKVLSVMVFHHLDNDTLIAGTRECLTLTRKKNVPGRMLILDAVWPLNRWNVLGKLLRSMDRGKHVRAHAEYQKLLREHFDIEKSYTFRVFPLDYVVFWIREKEPVVQAETLSI